MTQPIDWEKESTTGGGEQLDIISELAGEMLTIEDEMSNLQEKLATLQAKHQSIAQGSLPEAMLQLGITELKHVSGRKLIVEKFYQAKIPDSLRSVAFKYLEETGNDSIIKTELEAKFGKGEKEKAVQAAELLESRGFACTLSENIHHSTLRAFVREQIESGTAGFPLEAFGVYVGNRIKVK